MPLERMRINSHMRTNNERLHVTPISDLHAAYACLDRARRDRDQVIIGWLSLLQDPTDWTDLRKTVARLALNYLDQGNHSLADDGLRSAQSLKTLRESYAPYHPASPIADSLDEITSQFRARLLGELPRTMLILTTGERLNLWPWRQTARAA